MKELVDKIWKIFLAGSIMVSLQTKNLATSGLDGLLIKDLRKVIVLDPAHGKNNKEKGVMDLGDAVYKDYREVDIVLEIAKITKKMLDPTKYRVILTRYDNENAVPVEIRPVIANVVNADAFFSIHINNLWDPTVKGFEIYYRYDENKNLAYLGKENFQEHTLIPASKRRGGVIKENYKVLKGLDCPAALFEIGYISNEEDREKILNNLPSIAKAIAETAKESFEGDSI